MDSSECKSSLGTLIVFHHAILDCHSFLCSMWLFFSIKNRIKIFAQPPVKSECAIWKHYGGKKLLQFSIQSIFSCHFSNATAVDLLMSNYFDPLPGFWVGFEIVK